MTSPRHGVALWRSRIAPAQPTPTRYAVSAPPTHPGHAAQSSRQRQLRPMTRHSQAVVQSDCGRKCTAHALHGYAETCLQPRNNQHVIDNLAAPQDSVAELSTPFRTRRSRIGYNLYSVNASFNKPSAFSSNFFVSLTIVKNSDFCVEIYSLSPERYGRTLSTGRVSK